MVIKKIERGASGLPARFLTPGQGCLVYGTAETPEFQRQSRDFAAAVKAAGKPVTLSVMEGYNHFEVGEQLANPYSLFGRAVLEQMNLRSG